MINKGESHRQGEEGGTGRNFGNGGNGAAFKQHQRNRVTGEAGAEKLGGEGWGDRSLKFWVGRVWTVLGELVKADCEERSQ
ncbi:hypothetical protein PN441_12155 [Spirulina major CS-329]|uniref:hypothetical protein n=1 Tax=Spirulina TaxID=1154 RepID=UPI00232B5153|nr:hypothetical protein [Spirulina subsalsa]MDB9503826.1 hypothetical protein [Spirulina major CS-329]